MTKVIGLTGGIGSGKSTIARYLGKLGAAVIDTDKLAHEVYEPGTRAWQEIVDEFGKSILNAEGQIDRAGLGHLVFKDHLALKRLNEITHPLVLDATRELIKKYRKQALPVVVIEVPLLVEAGWMGLFDEVWVATTSNTKVIKRLQKQRCLSEQEILQRIQARLPETELIKNADVVISNEGSLAQLKKTIEGLWARLANVKD